MELPVVLRIDGMMCQNSCGTTVAKALQGVAGVTAADVSFPRDEAIVRGSASLSDLVAAVEASGEDSFAVPETLQVGGVYIWHIQFTVA